MAQNIALYVKLDYFVVYQRLIRLKGRELVEKAGRFWKLTYQGRDMLLQSLKQSARLPRAGATESHTLKQKLQVPPIPPKRTNGFDIRFPMFPTEYWKLEGRLTKAGIDFKPEKVKNSTFYTLRMAGYTLKFTTRNLIVYAPQAFYGFQIEGKVLLNEEVRKARQTVRDLLKLVPVRMVEDSGKLKAILAYYEIAHTQSGEAEAVTRRRSYAPLAYDLITGQMVHWADRSMRTYAEGEFSELTLEQKMANLTQDMKDGKWDHRYEKKLVRTILENQATQARLMTDFVSSQHFKDIQTSQLINELIASRGKQPERKRWANG